MKSFKGLLNRTKSVSLRNSRDSPQYNFDNAPIDSPEANVQHAIRAFCESGSNSNGGEEVLHLPVIVESAESSPVAAACAAYQIRRFLAREYISKPHVQYNAIMLIRILSDNPGATFTRNFDKNFVGAVKELLKHGKDKGTQQILRETLDALEADKSYDEGLQPLLQMWRHQKGQMATFSQASRTLPNQYPPGFERQDQRHGGSGRRHRGEDRGLPNAVELASRVEEAKNTAKILLQLVQSTPAEEVLSNELIKEFSERCQSAQRSMQNFINAEDPSPDHDTMQTLIETNEQLSLAMSRYQRSILAARRAMGVSATPPLQSEPEPEINGFGAFAAPDEQPTSTYTPAPATRNDGYHASEAHNTRQTYQGYQAPPGPPPGRASNPAPSASQTSSHQQPVDPFADPEDQSASHGAFRAPSPPHQRQQPSQTFHIDSEPTFATPQNQRRNTKDLENAYTPESQQQQQPPVSPVENRGSIPSDGVVSPSSPQRPGVEPYHPGDVTQSYVGRQEGAANGLSMHGGR